MNSWKNVKINNRFLLGGHSLRGFEPGGVGPRDLLTKDALGGNLMLLLEPDSPKGYVEMISGWGIVSGEGTLIARLSYVAPNLEFLQIKEELAVSIIEIIEANNAGFAFPSQSIYVEKK